jgi:hypothetical protein
MRKMDQKTPTLGGLLFSQLSIDLARSVGADLNEEKAPVP